MYIDWGGSYMGNYTYQNLTNYTLSSKYKHMHTHSQFIKWVSENKSWYLISVSSLSSIFYES